MHRTIMTALLALMLLSVTPVADAQIISTADRIEEDWALTIATPAPGVTCPQISTSIKPDSTDASNFATLTLNYRGMGLPGQ